MRKGGYFVNKKATESILVCVNHPDFSKELIAFGKRLSLEMNLPLQIVNIQPSANGYCARGHEIEQFYRQSKDAGAELTILFDDNFAAATAKFARKAGAKQIVTQLFNGESGGPDAFAQSLHSLVPTIPISMVSVSGKIYHIYPNYRPGFFHKTPFAG